MLSDRLKELVTSSSKPTKAIMYLFPRSQMINEKKYDSNSSYPTVKSFSQTTEHQSNSLNMEAV